MFHSIYQRALGPIIGHAGAYLHMWTTLSRGDRGRFDIDDVAYGGEGKRNGELEGKDTVFVQFINVRQKTLNHVTILLGF